jgi:hypothetical protein
METRHWICRERSIIQKGEIFALVNTSSGFTLSGNYSRALENSLEALKKSEAINKDQFLASSYFNISLVYSVQEDHRTSIPYGLKALGDLQETSG